MQSQHRVWHEPLPFRHPAEQTMAMPALDSHMWTADGVRALPSEPGKRFECVDGALLVSPGPRLPHQSVLSLLHELLAPYYRSHRIAAV